jgi:YgiT-type zinc finger domain-containing protein
MDAEPVADYLCPTCQTGHLQPRLAALAVWVDEAFITLPDFPAWVCDVCGKCEYDGEALEHLQTVLGPQAALHRGKRPTRLGARVPPGNPRGARRHFV